MVSMIADFCPDFFFIILYQVSPFSTKLEKMQSLTMK